MPDENQLNEWTQMLMDWLTQYAPKVGGAALFLIIAWIIAGWLSGLVRKSMDKARIDATLSRFAGKLASWGVRVIALISALEIFGVASTGFAAILGGAGLAIGLAFQGTLGSFAAGVMLMIFRPFKVGDVVTVSGITAKVHEIDLFSTTLDTPDNRRFIIPNGSIFGSTIENVTFHAKRRVDVAVGVDYSADIDRTREVLLAATTGIEGSDAEPSPVVLLAGLGASSVDWSVRVWANTPDFFAVKERLTRSIKMHLDEAGIGIPFPQMDVHLDHRPAT